MKDLERIQNFIDEITSTSSRNKKEEILTSYKDDTCIREFLQFIYNPFIATGVSDKKWDKCACVTHMATDIDRVNRLYYYLEHNNTGTINDVAVVKNVAFLYPEHAELIKKIVTKNIQLGVEAKTLNKVYGKGFVPTFDVMLAHKYFEHPEKVKGNFTITEKIDGQRIIAIKKGDDIKFYTREGQRYEGLVDLEEALARYPTDVVFDGELTLIESTGVSHNDYSKTVKIAHTKGDKHGLKMRVFDRLLPDEFESKCSVMKYADRQIVLHADLTILDSIFFEYVQPFYRGSEIGMIDKWLKYAEAHNMEGVMINLDDGVYEFKRSYNLLKVKSMDELDLKIIDAEEGTNKNKGKLGAFICEYKNSTVKVGGGYSDKQREEMWENKDDYIGMTMVVSYFEETVDSKTNLPSLRFPVFKEIRTDKVI